MIFFEEICGSFFLKTDKFLMCWITLPMFSWTQHLRIVIKYIWTTSDWVGHGNVLIHCKFHLNGTETDKRLVKQLTTYPPNFGKISSSNSSRIKLSTMMSQGRKIIFISLCKSPNVETWVKCLVFIMPFIFTAWSEIQQNFLITEPER